MITRVVGASRRTFSDSTFSTSHAVRGNRIAFSYGEDRQLLLYPLSDFHRRSEETASFLWDITGPVGRSRALQVPVEAANDVAEFIWSLERRQPDAQTFPIASVGPFLRERLTKINEVDAIFISSDPEFVHVWTVVAGPSKAEDKVYSIYEDCLFKYSEIPFDFVVLYRRNLPGLKPPDQAKILYRKK